jgi:hypothetical protein
MAVFCQAVPFPHHEKNEWAYLAAADLMAQANYPDSAIQAFKGRQDITRMEFAVLVNSVAIKLEQTGKEPTPQMAEALSKLLGEFQEEFLLLQLQQETMENKGLIEQLLADRKHTEFEIGGDFSLYAEKMDGRLLASRDEQEVFGQPPRHTKIMLAQQLRLRAEAEMGTGLKGRLDLRNFGYWGVGRYTSGSTEMNFSSADPLRVDQAYIFWKAGRIEAKIGRKFLMFGPWGLLVDRRYEPISGLEMGVVGQTSIKLLTASQFSGLDYLAGRLQTKEGKIQVGAVGFYTLFSRREIEESGLQNEQGAGLDIEIQWRHFGVSSEYALYKPERNKDAIKGYISGLILGLKGEVQGFGKIEIRLGSLAEGFLMNSIPLDVMPLEFQSSQQNFFISGTKGGQISNEIKISPKMNLRADWISMIESNGTHYLNRFIGRFEWRISENNIIIFEDNVLKSKEQSYNQAGLMLSLGF